MCKQKQTVIKLWEMFNKLIWLDEYYMKQSFEAYKPSEIHCIEYIGKNENANVTKLAENFYMTRGAISKLTKKLMSKGLIESYQKPLNKKEIYYKLTKDGEEIFKLHEKLHAEFDKRDAIVFEQFSEKEIDIVIRFAKQYDAHLGKMIEELGIDSKSGRFEKL